MPWRRSSAFAIAGFRLEISPLVFRPCLSVPSQTNVALSAIHHPRLLVAGGDTIHLGEARDALHHLHEAGAPQVVETMRTRLFGQLDAVPVFHDKTSQLSGNFNYFIDSDSTFIPFFALLAPLGMRFEDLKAFLDVGLGEAFRRKCFFRYVQGLLADRAQTSDRVVAQ